MNFPVLPPEINSVLMYSGAGSSPLLAAAAAWDGLAEELGSAAVSFGQVTSGLTAGVSVLVHHHRKPLVVLDIPAERVVGTCLSFQGAERPPGHMS